MNIIEEKTRELSQGIATQDNNILRKAILRHTGGAELVMADVARLGRVARFPDGSEVFSYGGVDMIRFWPVQVSTKVEGISNIVTATRQYEMLV